MKKKIPLLHALLIIFCTTCLISGSATGVWFYLRHLGQKRLQQETYVIRRIVQTGPQKEGLKTSYFAELLELSTDKPTYLYDLDLDWANERLLQSPVIEEAHISRIRPSTLFIDYTVRRPIALVYEHPNTAIDAHGRLFPLAPFFTPKKLPELILGFSDAEETSTRPWELGIPTKRLQIALELLERLQPPQFHVLRVDTSLADHESCGKREIVLILEERGKPCILRLNPTDYDRALSNYLKLRDTVAQTPSVVDLRIPQLAYLRRAQ